MKPLTTQLVLLAGVLAVNSADDLPESVVSSCPSAQALSSSTIEVNGQEIVHQIFTCPGGDFTDKAHSEAKAISRRSPRRQSSLETRSTIGCEFPQNTPECQCGASFTCNCFEGNVAPEEFDCTSLLDSVTSSMEGAVTFIVPASGLVTLTLRTCSLELTNLANSPLEFCWDDLNSVGEQAWIQCVSDESDRVVGGLCTAGSNRYQVSLGPAA